MTDFLSQEMHHQEKSITDINPKSLTLDSEKSTASPKHEHKMTEQEKEQNRKILKSMNRKLNFLRNPRFRNQSKCLLYSNALFQEILNKENPFVVEPMVITFREYQLNSVYQLDLKLTNRKQILTSFKYIPPLTEHFSVKQIIYPKKDASLIAPGMHAKIEVLFNAASMDSFEDEISIITEFFAFKVPLRAIREKPSLSLENPMNCGKCLLGDQTSMIFKCRNNGGDAHFKFLVDEEAENIDCGFNNGKSNRSRSDSSDKNMNALQSSGTNYTVDNEVLVAGPFSIFPQEFYLYKGMSLEIYVNFNPKYEDLIEKNLFICCDSKVNIPHKIQGEGISVDLKIVAIDDLLADESYEKLENIFFEDTYPSTSVSRRLIIKNLSNYQLKYHWNIYDMYQNNNNFLDVSQSFFTIKPESGIFEPLQEVTFYIYFQPKNCKNYEQKLDLIIEDVPFQAIKNFKINNLNNNFENFEKNGSIKLAKNTFTKGEPFMLALNSPYPSYPFFSFNMLGKGKQCEIDVDSRIIDIGNVFIGEKIKKQFNLYNSKSGVLKFKISKILQGMSSSAINSKILSNYFGAGNFDIDNNKKFIDVNNQNPLLKSIDYPINYNENEKKKKYENDICYGFDNGKLVNTYFKNSDPGKTFTDHLRTESIFKLKKPMELLVNHIFDKFTKEKENFIEKEGEIILDVNKSIVMNDDSENTKKTKNDTNKNLKSTNSQNDDFKNSKSKIDNNFPNNSNLKNCKFLKLLTLKDNFTNKVIMRENSKILKHIKTRLTFNSSNKYFNKNTGIKDSLNNSSSCANHNSNHLNKMSVIIRRPESYVTSHSSNFSNNNKNNINVKNLLLNNKLEPISESINENGRINNNKDDANNKKSTYLLYKPLAKSQQFQKPNRNSNTTNNKTEENPAQNQIDNLKDPKMHMRKSLLKPLSSNFDIINTNNNNQSIKFKASNLSKSTNSYILKNQNSIINDEYSDQVEINESDELVIYKDKTLAIEISFLPFKLGLFKCSCIINAEDGIPFSVDFTANVIGPQVIADVPALDFGLFSISEIRTIKFKLVNTSRTPATYLIKETRFKNVNFDNYLDSFYLNDMQGIIVEKKFKRHVKNLNDFENENMRVMDIDVIDNYDLKFSSIFGVIKEKSEVEITVS